MSIVFPLNLQFVTTKNFFSALCIQRPSASEHPPDTHVAHLIVVFCLTNPKKVVHLPIKIEKIRHGILYNISHALRGGMFDIYRNRCYLWLCAVVTHVQTLRRKRRLLLSRTQTSVILLHSRSAAIPISSESDKYRRSIICSHLRDTVLSTLLLVNVSKLFPQREFFVFKILVDDKNYFLSVIRLIFN